jgi:DNA-binding NarL/FixJ family response regulator
VPTYVSSIQRGVRVAHLGNEHGVACGRKFFSAFYVSASLPADRYLCQRCADKTAHREQVAAARQSSDVVRDALIVSLLADGLDDAALCQRLRIGTRTASRYINDAQRRAGARTRFQWAFRKGFQRGFQVGRYGRGVTS